VNTRRRPRRSARRPIGTSPTAAARRKEVATQPRATALTENSRPMAGRATFTDELMKGVRNEARDVMRSTRRSFDRLGIPRKRTTNRRAGTLEKEAP
jgi:hypothetical protein